MKISEKMKIILNHAMFLAQLCGHVCGHVCNYTIYAYCVAFRYTVTHQLTIKVCATMHL